MKADLLVTWPILDLIDFLDLPVLLLELLDLPDLQGRLLLLLVLTIPRLDFFFGRTDDFWKTKL